MQVLAKRDSFVNGRLVPAGFTTSVRDDLKLGKNFEKLTGDEPKVAVVEIAAIAPTGPNPDTPQQLAPDMIQSVEGYVKPGAILVGEVTKPVEQRIEIVGIGDKEDTSEGDAVEALAEAKRKGGQNDDDELVAGTIADLSEKIANADEEELDRLQAAEQDREKPRAGVLSRLDKRREELQG